MTEARHGSKTKLLNAALQGIRAKGYTAARVEDVCVRLQDLRRAVSFITSAVKKI
jgi:hypothetical protein